eukprot:9221810-Pyramimonas_sp.AAC.1
MSPPSLVPPLSSPLSFRPMPATPVPLPPFPSTRASRRKPVTKDRFWAAAGSLAGEHGTGTMPAAGAATSGVSDAGKSTIEVVIWGGR